jgi:hypothetical protein
MAGEDGAGTLEAIPKEAQMPEISTTDLLVVALVIAIWYAAFAVLFHLGEKLTHIHLRH